MKTWTKRWRHIGKKWAWFWPLLPLLTACCDPVVPPEPEDAERTLIIYMVADNNLYSYSKENIRAMLSSVDNQMLASNRLIIAYGSSRFNNGNRLLEVRPIDDRKRHQPDTVCLKTYADDNMLDTRVMQQVLEDAIALAPAKHYSLLLWSHATGWVPKSAGDLKNAPFWAPRYKPDLRPLIQTRTFGQDNLNQLEIPDLASVLERFDFDLIVADACLMAGVETAYELRHSARYLLASAGEIMGSGFPYHLVTPLLLDNLPIKEMAIKVADCFMDYYRNYTQFNTPYPHGTLTLVDLQTMDSLAMATRTYYDMVRQERLKTRPTGKPFQINYEQALDIQSYENRRNPLFVDFLQAMEMFREICWEESEEPPLDMEQPFEALREQLERTIVYFDCTRTLYSMLSGQASTLPIDKSENCGLSCFVDQSVTNDNAIKVCAEQLPKTAWGRAIGLP